MRSGTDHTRALSSPPQHGDLVPRMGRQGYAPHEVESRRRWLADQTGANLEHVGKCSIPTESMRGNVENPIGSVQVPLGVAGPLQINGEFADGVYYVPLATTEGALVRSYERGMLVLSRSGGVTARVIVDENCIAPTFCFEGLIDACAFARALPDRFEEVRRVAESTTRHGRLLRLEPRVLGRDVSVRFCFHTADAHGMNMIMKATDVACRWLMEWAPASRYYVITGSCSEKRAGGAGARRREGQDCRRRVRRPCWHAPHVPPGHSRSDARYVAPDVARSGRCQCRGVQRTRRQRLDRAVYRLRPGRRQRGQRGRRHHRLRPDHSR